MFLLFVMFVVFFVSYNSWNMEDVASITFEAVNHPFERTHAEFIVRNNSNEPICFDADYILEKLINNEWAVIYTASETDGERIWVNPGQANVFRIDWEENIGELANGTYRITKLFNTEIRLSAEFSINR
jgi:hypothetical protein